MLRNALSFLSSLISYNTQKEDENNFLQPGVPARSGQDDPESDSQEEEEYSVAGGEEISNLESGKLTPEEVQNQRLAPSKQDPAVLPTEAKKSIEQKIENSSQNQDGVASKDHANPEGVERAIQINEQKIESSSQNQDGVASKDHANPEGVERAIQINEQKIESSSQNHNLEAVVSGSFLGDFFDGGLACMPLTMARAFIFDSMAPRSLLIFDSGSTAISSFVTRYNGEMWDSRGSCFDRYVVRPVIHGGVSLLVAYGYDAARAFLDNGRDDLGVMPVTLLVEAVIAPLAQQAIEKTYLAAKQGFFKLAETVVNKVCYDEALGNSYHPLSPG
jgi:hypothetical protein